MLGCTGPVLAWALRLIPPEWSIDPFTNAFPASLPSIWPLSSAVYMQATVGCASSELSLMLWCHREPLWGMTNSWSYNALSGMFCVLCTKSSFVVNCRTWWLVVGFGLWRLFGFWHWTSATLPQSEVFPAVFFPWAQTFDFLFMWLYSFGGFVYSFDFLVFVSLFNYFHFAFWINIHVFSSFPFSFLSSFLFPSLFCFLVLWKLGLFVWTQPSWNFLCRPG